MTRRRLGAVTALSLGVPVSLSAQSTHLSALEGSAPPSVVEPTAGAARAGLAAVWTDPTASPSATGGFFSVYQSAYAGVRLFHAALAFRWGPRWSIIYGSTEISDLFDSSLISQDPGLANLRARAVWGGVDATVVRGPLSASLGLALAGDENVGDFQTGTVARSRVRFSPLRSGMLSIAAQWSGAIGGTLAANPSGRQQVDMMMTRGPEDLLVTLSAALSRGSYWKYSENVGGYAVAARVSALSRLDLGVGLGRYATAFGATRHEWQRSVSGGLRFTNLRLGVRYSSTRLGLGSGYGASLSYEPQFARRGQEPPDAP